MFLYRWTIEKIEGFPEFNGMINVVGTVYWELEIRDTEDHSIHYIREVTQLGTPDAETFIDHLELDSETILGWVWVIVDKTLMEQRITNELNAMRAPKPPSVATQLAMPWMSSCCPDGTMIDQNTIVGQSQNP
jgi:hypothetical protein